MHTMALGVCKVGRWGGNLATNNARWLRNEGIVPGLGEIVPVVKGISTHLYLPKFVFNETKKKRPSLRCDQMVTKGVETDIQNKI